MSKVVEFTHSYVQLKEKTPTLKQEKYFLNHTLTPKKTGLLLVGLGGNNGSTLYASLMAHKHNLKWRTKEGVFEPNFYGSLTQSSTMKLGLDEKGNEVFCPMKDVVQMVNPLDLVIDGWDIKKEDMADAMQRSQVLPYDLQRQLYPILKEEGKIPMPSIWKEEFIASNQKDRATNVLPLPLNNDLRSVGHIAMDIQAFKQKHDLETVIVLWTANTERMNEVCPIEVHSSMSPFEFLVKKKEQYPSYSFAPSTLFALASIMEGCPFINGSPQNTLTPDLMKLAEMNGILVAGDDFKSGQTKMKSALVDWLLGAGIKPRCIASYNHLGNNDGKNLHEAEQFKSKEISKTNVIQDMIETNSVLYDKGEEVDHCIVIKYLPYVGDSKRAMDEYTSEIFMNGKSTITIHNVCEDSLLATPIILDLALLVELFTRIKLTDTEGKEKKLSVQSLLSYFLKAPLQDERYPLINSLYRQRTGIENLFRILNGFPIEDNLFFF